MIPKILWTYWNDTDIPPLVNKCINSWRTHHPDFSVFVLNQNNYSKYVDINIKRNINKNDALFSDILRLSLIKKYGGIWFDSSIMCYSHISTLFDINDNSDLYAFHIENFTTRPEYPVIENWFFGANCCSRFIIAWDEELRRNLDDFESNDAYIQDLKKKNVDIQNIFSPAYLSMHCAAQKVLQKSNVKYNLTLKSVYDGPFKLHGDADWDCEKMKELLKGSNAYKYKQNLLKLRGSDRECFPIDIL